MGLTGANLGEGGEGSPSPHYLSLLVMFDIFMLVGLSAAKCRVLLLIAGYVILAFRRLAFKIRAKDMEMLLRSGGK